jgi:PAS domain-containing protein
MQVRVGHGAIMSREDDGAGEALSSRERELRLLVETIPARVWRAGPKGNVEFAAQLQATLNVIPAYTWYAAPSGGLTFVNKRTADYLGLPKDHPLRFGIDTGAPWDAHIPLLHPDDREESRKAWSTCLRTGEAAEFSQRVPNAQGDYRWFLSRAEPLRASDGTLLQWVGVNLDIEELKRTEQALRESERSARSALDGIAGLIAIMAPNGEFVTCDQFVEYKIADPEQIATWINGYYHGAHGSPILDSQEMLEITNTVEEHCFKHPGDLVMRSVEGAMGSR